MPRVTGDRDGAPSGSALKAKAARLGRSPRRTAMQVAIFLFDGMTALDAIGPYASLARLPDVQIVFVGRDAGIVRTGDGFLGLQADVGIADVPSADLLIIPGGGSVVRSLLADTDLHEWIRSIDRNSRWTASVCTGSLLLAAAGVLAGRTAATHWRAQAG